MRFAIKRNPPGQWWEYVIDTDIGVTNGDERKLLVMFVNTIGAAGGCRIGIYSRKESDPNDIDAANVANLTLDSARLLGEALSLARSLAVGIITVQ